MNHQVLNIDRDLQINYARPAKPHRRHHNPRRTAIIMREVEQCRTKIEQDRQARRGR